MKVVLLYSLMALTGITFAFVSEKAQQRWDTIVFSTARDHSQDLKEERESVRKDIYIVNLDGSGENDLISNGACNRFPRFSPDGKMITIASNKDGEYEIYIINTDGSHLTRLTKNEYYDGAPCFSPDGKKIAFESIRKNNRDIFIMNIDGSNQTRLTANKGSDGDFSFSPDGKKILFVSYRNGHRSIFIMDANGRNQTRLTSDADDRYPYFMLGGKKVAFIRLSDWDWQIFSINIDGSEMTQLTLKDDTYMFCSSPDGSKILFGSVIDDNQEIYIMNADGSQQTRLTFNKVFDSQARFTPDNKHILYQSGYRSKTDGKWVSGIYTMKLDGSEQTFVAEIEGMETSFCCSPMLISGKLLDEYGQWHEIGE